jgi:hypothetical protein
MIGREHLSIDMGRIPISLFKGQTNRHRGAAGGNCFAKSAIGEDGRTESGVENRSDPGSDEGQTGIKIHNHREVVTGKEREGKMKKLDLGLHCRL